MHLLRNGAMNYDWGSPHAIPTFLGEGVDGRPVAEVWIGTHPMKPSEVSLEDGSVSPLSEVAGELPYLVKLLAAERPLSLQVHPSRSLAEIGYEREDAEGIPLDAPNRSYRDRNAKAEMVYALSTFDTLIGFRPTAEILRVLGPLHTELSDRLSEDLRADPGYAGIVRRIEWLLSSEVQPDEIAEVIEACRRLAASGLDVRRAYQTALEIAELHPSDIGVVLSLMLNRMTLQPGEAAFLETGVLHAHLRGFALEVMVSSDNVLRAGLTNKHIDRRGLVACLHAGMARVARVTPDVVDTETEVFSPANVGFALAVTQVSHAIPEGVQLVGELGSVVVCTGGEVELVDETGNKLPLRRGESAFLSPDAGRVCVQGLGEVAQAYTPHRRALHSRLVDVL